VDDTLARIDAGPLRYPVTFAGLRRALVRRFAYAVFFAVESDDRIIFAVHHQSQSRDVVLERLDID
jgi:plasmid stabilization system protein ParE